MNLYRKRHRDPFNTTMPSLFSSDYSTSDNYYCISKITSLSSCPDSLPDRPILQKKRHNYMWLQMETCRDHNLSAPNPIHRTRMDQILIQHIRIGLFIKDIPEIQFPSDMLYIVTGKQIGRAHV